MGPLHAQGVGSVHNPYIIAEGLYVMPTMYTLCNTNSGG